MSTFTDLARKLGNVELSSSTSVATSTHALKFEYPVKELLPEGALPYLEQPTLVAQRERPPFDPVTVGVYDSTVFAMLEVQARNPFALAPAKDSAAGLVFAVEAAATKSGSSLLEMASYKDAAGDIVRRLCLTSNSETTTYHTQAFTISDEQWRELLKQESRVPWIWLLAHLVNRRSARAYYHVRNRLYAAYGEVGVEAEEASWAVGWASKPPRGVMELLLSRLGCNDGLDTKQSSLLVKLPCGHESMVRKMKLLALTADACSTYSCRICHERVLQPADDGELALRNERRRAHAYALSSSEDWHSLDRRELDNARDFPVSASALLCALAAALGSLRAPAFICPPEILFLSFPETRRVFAELEGFFADTNWTCNTTTASNLYNSLMSCAATTPRVHQALDGPKIGEGMLPLGWTDDLSRWMTPTVRLIANRGCMDSRPQHRGLHKHYDLLYCGLRNPEDRDSSMMEEEAGDDSEEAVTSMEQLADFMNEASLGEDPTGLDDLEKLEQLEENGLGMFGDEDEVE